MKHEYDYIVVGSGLFGAVFTRQALNKGKKCLVVEKRPHIGGNVYTDLIENIHVHTYGAHIFHSSIKCSWDYIQKFAEFNHFINSPIANFRGEIYNLPFNMNTFRQMWGVITPDEAKKFINSQQEGVKDKPKNLEEHAISLVGRDIYEKLIKPSPPHLGRLGLEAGKGGHAAVLLQKRLNLRGQSLEKFVS